MKMKRFLANAVTTAVMVYLFAFWFRHIDRELSATGIELFQGWIGTTIGVVVLILLWLLLFFTVWLWDLLQKGGQRK